MNTLNKMLWRASLMDIASRGRAKIAFNHKASLQAARHRGLMQCCGRENDVLDRTFYAPDAYALAASWHGLGIAIGT